MKTLSVFLLPFALCIALFAPSLASAHMMQMSPHGCGSYGGYYPCTYQPSYYYSNYSYPYYGGYSYPNYTTYSCPVNYYYLNGGCYPTGAYYNNYYPYNYGGYNYYSSYYNYPYYYGSYYYNY